MMDELAHSRKEKIAIYALIAFVIVVTMAIGLAVIAKAFGSEGKGLKVDLDVDNQFMNQYSEVDTFQNGRFVGTHDIYINQGKYLYMVITTAIIFHQGNN